MTAATARARGLRDAEGSEGKHRSLSPVHPSPRPFPPTPPLDATRHPHVLPSLSLSLSSSLPAAPSPSPSPSPSTPVLRDFPRFLLSIRHGVIFPSCSRRVAAPFFPFPRRPSEEQPLHDDEREEATSETRKQRTATSRLFPSPSLLSSFPFLLFLFPFSVARKQVSPYLFSSDETVERKGKKIVRARSIARRTRDGESIYRGRGRGRSVARWWHCLFSLGHIA